MTLKYQDRQRALSRSSILSEGDVIKIKQRLASGEPTRTIARSYQVGTETIRRISRGDTWAWLTPEQGECQSATLEPKWPCACGAVIAEGCTNPRAIQSDEELKRLADESLARLTAKLEEGK